MASDKRKMNPQFEQDDDIFQIKKKSSYISMDTNDSAPKEDTNLSPIVLKPYNGEPAVPTDSQTSMIKDKPSVTKVLSHKKKENSAQSVSFDEGVKYYMSDPSRYIDTFKAVKYKDIKYSLGANMLIKNEGDAYSDFVCKLVRVIKPAKRDNKGILAFLEIQWYYKKDELPKKYAASMPHLSINEVFLSTHKDFVMVDCINGPCQILQYQEFDKLETIPPGTYFTRATYDAGRKRLEPPIESWEKYCLCKTPLNPDRSYIQCDKCESWYHQDCVGLSKEETHAIEQYFCSSCTEKKDNADNGFNFDKQQELLFDENMFAITTHSGASDKPKDGFNDAFINAGQNTGKSENVLAQATDDNKMFDFISSPQGDLTDIFFENFEQSEVKIDFDQGFN